MRNALRRVPAPLLLAVVGGFVIALYGVVYGLTVSLHGPADRGDGTFSTLLAGGRTAASVLEVVGLAWLARRLAGRARIGARIALVGAVLDLAFRVSWFALAIYEILTYADESRMFFHVQGVAFTASAVVLALGLGIAARRWIIAIAGAAILFLARPLGFIADAISAAFVHDLRSALVFRMGLQLVAAVTVLALVFYACRDAAPAEDAAPPVAGLRRVGLALYGLAIATGLLVAFVLLLQRANPYEAIERLGVVCATACELACLVALALGALDAARRSERLPGWLLVASAAASLCVAGRLLGRVAELVQRSFEGYFGAADPMRQTGLFFGVDEPTWISALSAQLLAACAIGGVLIALAIAARRRGLEALRARMIVACGIFVVLTLGAITAQRQIVGATELTGMDLVVLVAASAALVASWLVAAISVRRAGAALAGGASLPAAQLVRR